MKCCCPSVGRFFAVAFALLNVVGFTYLFRESSSPTVVSSEIGSLQETDQPKPPTLVVGEGSGWSPLTFADFVNVNCNEKTWTESDGLIVCSGDCHGGFRSKESYENFEMVLEWKHLKRSGNSGVFIWCPKTVLDNLKPGALPQGIEIQILDHGYAEDWEKSKGSPPDWFTTDGDVFPVGVGKMKPFEPKAPDGARSFPSSKHSKGFGQWNHYYVRAINGEVRLWVNGHEVSGGNECSPSSGHLVLEAESAPIEFRNIKVRKLP